MRWALVILAGLALAAGGGCMSPSQGRKISWRTLTRGLTSGLTEPRRQVIRDEITFLKVWADHAAELGRMSPPPSVNFTNEMVVVVAMGTKSTGGYIVEIVDAELRGRTLRVLVGERAPTPGTLQMQMPTQPVQFIALPAMTARVEFRNASESGKRSMERDARPGEAGSARVVPRRKTEPVQSPKGAANGP